MKHVCKKPAKHLRRAIDFLRAIGAEVAPIRQGKTQRLSWRYRGQTFTLWVAICRHGRGMAEELVRFVAQQMRRKGIVLPVSAGAIS